MGLQEVISPIIISTWVKDILGIVKNGVQEVNPLVRNPYDQGNFGNANSMGAGTKHVGCREHPH